MALSNETVKAIYQGNGSTTTFAIPFTPIVSDTTETKVYIRDESVNPAVETLKLEGVGNDYTLTGATGGGFNVNVVFNAGKIPIATDKILVIRSLPLTQTLELITSGQFQAESQEKQFDRLAAMVQQINNEVQRCPKIEISHPNSDTLMPRKADEVLGWDVTANTLVTIPRADVAASTGNFLTTTNTVTVSGKTLVLPKIDDALVFAEQATDPAAPASGFKNMYAKTDGKVYTRDSAGNIIEVGSGAGSGGVNYAGNPDIEAGITGFNLYSDGAVAAPLDGTGGTASGISLSETTSSIRGSKSLRLFKTVSLNSQGSGFSEDITIKAIDKNRIIFVSFDYRGSASYPANDLQAYVYDITGATLLGPLTNDDGGFLKVTSTDGGKFVGTFQAKTSLSYRIIFHVVSTQTNTYTVDFDNFKYSSDVLVPGAIVQDLGTFTPTTTWTSNITWTGHTHRFGRWARIAYNSELSNTSEANTLTLNLPSGYVIDTAQLLRTSSGDWSLDGGFTTRESGTGQQHNLKPKYVSTTTFTLDAPQISVHTGTVYLQGGLSVTNLIPFTWGASDFIEGHIFVPIVGWSDGATLSTTETLFSTVKARYSTATAQSFANNVTSVVNYDTKDYDTHDAVTIGAAWKFTAPKDGMYHISARMLFQSSTSWTEHEHIEMLLRVNSVVKAALARPSGLNSSANSQFFGAEGATTYKLLKGDFIDVTVAQISGVSQLLNNQLLWNHISIEELPDFSIFSVFGKNELIESKQSSAAYSITVDQYGDLASISLGSGQWEIDASASYESAGATTTGFVYLGVSTTTGNSATGLTEGDTLVIDNKTGTSGDRSILNTPKINVTISSSTTYYLKGQATTSITNLNVSSKISARRIA